MGGCQCAKSKEINKVIEIDGNPPSKDDKPTSAGSNKLNVDGVTPVKKSFHSSFQGDGNPDSYVKPESFNDTHTGETSMKNKSQKVLGEVIDFKSFINSLFFEYNLARTNPKLYCEKIRSHMKFIKMKNNQFYYEYEGLKVSLKNGDTFFNHAIEIMSNLQSLPLIQYNENLTIYVPENYDEQMKSNLFRDKKQEDQYLNKNLGFNLDICSMNAEVSCVLQLVDDTLNKGQRRNNILNPNNKFVGISVGKGKKKHYTIYSTFSD